jgi:3-hydroxyacyl-CoA dehydrogenase
VVKDSPGFVTSRLLHPVINDAVRIVAEGVATVEAVDALMEGWLGHPTGPLRTASLIGLDDLAGIRMTVPAIATEQSDQPTMAQSITTAAILALGQRDGVSLDRLVLAAVGGLDRPGFDGRVSSKTGAVW